MVQETLCVLSLLRENPTIDEVAHLPAGLSYWEKGTFRLYPHNPPLIKLTAALPVALSRPVVDPLYALPAWTGSSPSQAVFAQLFALLNADRYFELFALGRLVMPLFALGGGLVVYGWSARLYGRGGGLLSLALWSFCPNVLAHARLVTSDLGATALGAGASYLFWLYLRQPTWRRVVPAGIVLGLAELAKFSMLLLYFAWPVMWLAHELLAGQPAGRARRFGRAAVQGMGIVGLSVLTIDLGYGFEGVGLPLGSLDFASRSPFLTRPGRTLDASGRPKRSMNQLLDVSWARRVNRYRGTFVHEVPTPLPKYYLLGFDEQKIEADGLPLVWLDPDAGPNERTGYAVYLNGDMRRHGWWYYYLFALAYKVPEGTWVLVGLSLVVLVETRRSREAWADEAALSVVPTAVLLGMSFLTDICLGLRYILPVFPYLFIATGKLVPWTEGSRGWHRPFRRAVIGLSVAATATAAVAIHPHYLAYFNWVSGGPDRGHEHLIDSNLDWGQDLVGLRDWLDEHAKGERVGLAYFGQIHPNLLRMRKEGFEWFLPPVLPGTTIPNPAKPEVAARRLGPAPALEPGLYAVSATLLHGLPWRFYDPSMEEWLPAWNAHKEDAFGYFRELTPIARVGHSIFIYRVDDAASRRLAHHWRQGPARGSDRPEAGRASVGVGDRLGRGRHDRVNRLARVLPGFGRDHRALGMNPRVGVDRLLADGADGTRVGSHRRVIVAETHRCRLLC